MGTRKKFTIFFFSILCCLGLGILIDLACGPEPDPYDYYVSFFHNNLQKNDGYRPFYFNGYTFLNGYTFEAERDNKIAEGDINVKEWMAYMGGGVTYKDISRVLYEFDENTDSLYFRGYRKGVTKMPDSLKNNAFIKRLLADKKKIDYIVLAKKSGPFVSPSNDAQWDAMGTSKDKQHALALKYIKMGIGLNDKFLKLRCFYQAQRLLHYGGYFYEASGVYNKYIKKVRSKSHVIGWALSLQAGEAEHLGHKEQAAYLYSRVFALCPERRVRINNSFMSMKVAVSDVIKLARNNKEKAFIYAIKGFHEPQVSLRSLSAVYKTDPRSELLSVLLIREINKIEEHYLTPKLNGPNYYDSTGFYGHDKYDSVKSIYTTYIPKLKAFCNRLATGHKYPEPVLGYLGSAYLSWMGGETQTGLQTLNEIDHANLRGKLYDQKQLIKLLLLSQSIKKINAAAERKLVPSLTWLDKKVRAENKVKITTDGDWISYDGKYYSASSRDFYARVLAPLYFRQKDTAMAALCILRSEKTLTTLEKWYDTAGLGFDMPSFWQTAMHSYHLKKILDWDASSQKTPYLKVLMKEFHQAMVTRIFNIDNTPAKGYNIKKTLTPPERTIIPAIYDLLGTAYLREHKYAKAVKAFGKVKFSKLSHSVAASYDTTDRYANPFIEQLKNYPLVYTRKKVYNKLTFAITMAGLEKRVKTTPKNAAECYYKMANGLYNTSFYGNAWNYTVYAWANDDIFRKKKHYYDEDYLSERTAEKYFLKAIDLSNDKEFKARCAFMAAKCRQKQISFPESYTAYLTGKKYDLDESNVITKKYDYAMRHNPYFTTLRNNYNNTAFYKVAVHECSYLRDYLASSSKQKNSSYHDK